jgi:hypothetical protein
MKSLILYTITITILFNTAGLPITAAIILTSCWYYTQREPLDKKTWRRIGNLCILLILLLIPTTLYYALTEKPTCWMIVDGTRYDADCDVINDYAAAHRTQTTTLTAPNGSPYHIRLYPTSPNATRPYTPQNQTP